MTVQDSPSALGLTRVEAPFAELGRNGGEGAGQGGQKPALDEFSLSRPFGALQRGQVCSWLWDCHAGRKPALQNFWL